MELTTPRRCSAHGRLFGLLAVVLLGVPACAEYADVIVTTADSLDFGTVVVGAPPVTLEIEVHNVGSRPVEVLSIDLPEGVTASRTSFTVLPDPGIGTFVLRIATDTAREISGEFVVHTDDPVTPDHTGVVYGEIVE